MRYRTVHGLWIATVLVTLCSQGCMSVTITTESLLNEMTDLSRLAELPVPAYTTKQFSSYDPASKTPDDYEGWFANNDCGQYLRVEDKGDRKEYVMMDTDGPGAIVRIWSANPEGTLRIYIDGSDIPVIEARMADLLGGKLAELPEPISGIRARGANLYFPIPYAKHCKVTSDKGAFYYHVNYRTYEPETKVKSFTKHDLTTPADKIQKVTEQLKQSYGAEDIPVGAKPTLFEVDLKAGDTQPLAQITGPAAICTVQVQLNAKDIEAAARSLILAMTFDNEQTVECPLGDFFGTAPGLTPYEALPAGISVFKKPILWCHWLMPFQRSAKITVKNLGDNWARLQGQVAVKSYKWTDRSLLFHAKWRIEKNISAHPRTDWTHLKCTGNGRFVGGALNIANSVTSWWGEGDEKIYVDGEKFPSHFGTGTEDYYGYAWCSRDLFFHAYHNQPRCDGPRNKGHSSVNRFHIIDDIPFTKQFHFDIENWHGRHYASTTRAAVSYWYARPGGMDFFKPITPDDVTPPEIPDYNVPVVPGAIEGETMKQIEVPNRVKIRAVENFSGEKCIWWKNPKLGDKLVLGFETAEAGKKRLIVHMLKRPNFAIVQMYVNDQKAGDTIDLYADRALIDKELDLGEVNVIKGQNRLTIEIIGINEKAEKHYECALDYIKLQ